MVQAVTRGRISHAKLLVHVIPANLAAWDLTGGGFPVFAPERSAHESLLGSLIAYKENE